ncbi:MAG: DUF4280 domain-containing protein [Bacteroidales bacterium]
MAENYVCDGAKIECKLCTKPQGTLVVSSNQVKLQDKFFATIKDKQKLNLVFEGNCKKSWLSATPCAALIAPDEWQNPGDLTVQDSPVLHEDSTIMCMYGGVPIKITDHLQKSEPCELQPLAAPVVAPIEDPMITGVEWKKDDDSTENKAYIEVSTLNILPGEEIEIDLDNDIDQQ